MEAEVEAKLESEDAEAKERRLLVAPIDKKEVEQLSYTMVEHMTYEGHLGNLPGHVHHLSSSSRQREGWDRPSVSHSEKDSTAG